jgi:hypothetical protein
VRIFVDPSDQAWDIVDGVVKEQRKGCEIASARWTSRRSSEASSGRDST